MITSEYTYIYSVINWNHCNLFVMMGHFKIGPVYLMMILQIDNMDISCVHLLADMQD